MMRQSPKRVQHEGVKIKVRSTAPDPEFWESLIREMLSWQKNSPRMNDEGRKKRRDLP